MAAALRLQPKILLRLFLRGRLLLVSQLITPPERVSARRQNGRSPLSDGPVPNRDLRQEMRIFPGTCVGRP
eukprot:1941632-Pyramimonas_sp.AAC.2